MRTQSIAILTTGLLTSSAFAGVMNLDFDRRSLIYATSSEDLATGQIHDRTTDTGFETHVPFSEWDFYRDATIPVWQLEGSHYSTVSETTLSAQGTILGSVGPGSSDYLLNWALASNTYEIDFSITETTSFNLIANFEVSGSPSEVFISDQTQSEFFYHANRNTGTLNIDEQITLDAGSYKFRLSSTVDLWYPQTVRSASYSGSLTVVPAPSALGLLTMTGILATRRRR